MLIARCTGCDTPAHELEEYIVAAREFKMDVHDYIRKEEGTYNEKNGHILCTLCYVLAGCPSAPGEGWKAP